MENRALIFAVVIAALIGGSYLIIKHYPQIQSYAIIKPIAEAYGLIEEPVTPTSYNAVFCIFDPSGSGRTTYSVPAITSKDVSEIISAIERNGYGDFWLTYIDRNALNNKVLHFEVPMLEGSLRAPVRKPGQLKGAYERELAKFRIDSSNKALELADRLRRYSEAKEHFLLQCTEMISKAYAPKSPLEDYSDVIGAINTALRSLATIQPDSVHFRSIVLVSDGVHDTPKGDPVQKLNDIPSDITLVVVNHSGSLNSVVAGKALEMDNLGNALKRVIRKY